MNPDNGGQSSEDRQRQTAAEIARKKVLSAYSTSTVFSSQNQIAGQPISTATQITANPTTYKTAEINTVPKNAELQRYHSAWQNYYQKYYNDYYSILNPKNLKPLKNLS